MNRREMTLALAAFAAAPFIARAQQRARPARVAMVGYANPAATGFVIEALKQGMRERGYIEGKDYVFEVRWAYGKVERLPEVAKEVLALKPDVIVVGGTIMAVTAHKATSTIPIVAISVSDPVGSGVAESLARPGRNVTGLSFLLVDVNAKLLELLLAAVPRLSRVAVLWNPSSLTTDAYLKNLESAAQHAKVGLVVLEAQTPADIDGAFARMTRDKIGAAIVPSDSLYLTQRRQIAELAMKNRIASVYASREHVEAGGLMSYGQDWVAGWRYAATFIDKILKGAKPGDLPFEQSTTFELAVNLKTAKAIGVTIPQSVLIRADKVIE